MRVFARVAPTGMAAIWIGIVNNNFISGSISGSDCLYFIGTTFNLKKIM